MKITRRTKLLVVALALCFTTMIGSTFAWFTDTVDSGVNTITAGNLDMKVSYKPYGATNNTWTEVTEETKIFKDGALYEPGYTEAYWLKIENEGNLAFRYQAAMNIILEKAGTNKAGESFYLSDYLVVKFVNVTDTDMESIYPTRASLGNFAFGAAANSGEKTLNSNDLTIATNAVAFPENDPTMGDYSTGYVLIILQMPTTVGNEANHNGTVPEIKLGLNVVATQLLYEEDSFGSNYDEEAEYPTLLQDGKELHASSTKTGKYRLGSNITTSAAGDDARYGYGYEYIIRNGADYTLDLNGKTITHDTVNENANKNAFTYTFVANQAGTKLTINGEGTIHAHNSEGYTCAVQGKDGTLITINGGDYQVDNGIAVWAGAGAHIIINGGSYVNGNAKTNHELIYSSGGVIDIYGGFFHNTDGNYTLNIEDRNRATGFINVYGGTYVNFDPSTGGQDPNNIKVMDGYKVVSETKDNGDVWYTVVPE